MTTNTTATAGEVTAVEELKRYYKKLNGRTKPLLDGINGESMAAEPELFEEGQAANKLFKEDGDGSDDEWTGVTAPGEVPTVSHGHYDSCQPHAN